MEDGILKITNRERIDRILEKLIQSQAQVLIRSHKDLSIAVKGRLTNMIDFFVDEQTKAKGIGIGDVSDKGLRYLGGHEVLQIEFILMSTKVVFVSRVLISEGSYLIILVPNQLTSIERRINARYKATADYSGFLKMEIFKPGFEDYGAPPFLPQQAHLSSMLKLDDVSLGGLSVSSHFPSVTNVAKRGVIDDGAMLILPLQKPVICPLQVKWTKRVTSHHKDHDGQLIQVPIFKIGFEFISASEELKNAIIFYVQNVSRSEAI